jgi:large subunit ribosomal protein L6
MSRIGKKSIHLPSDVSLVIENKKITITGKYGSLEKVFLDYVDFKIENQEIYVLLLSETKKGKSYHGLSRALLQNMIRGVQEEFSKILLTEGVGYKFQLDKRKLILNMGFTHPVEFFIPEELTIKLESPTKILISGIDKEKVGFLAAKIREIRPPEPYKGKGILYQGEKIRRKTGKTGK